MAATARALIFLVSGKADARERLDRARGQAFDRLDESVEAIRLVPADRGFDPGQRVAERPRAKHGRRPAEFMREFGKSGRFPIFRE